MKEIKSKQTAQSNPKKRPAVEPGEPIETTKHAKQMETTAEYKVTRPRASRRKTTHDYTWEIKDAEDKQGNRLEFDVEYTYHPEQVETRDQEGIDAWIGIETVTLNGFDMMIWLENIGFDWDTLRTDIMEAHCE